MQRSEVRGQRGGKTAVAERLSHSNTEAASEAVSRGSEIRQKSSAPGVMRGTEDHLGGADGVLRGTWLVLSHRGAGTSQSNRICNSLKIDRQSQAKSTARLTK